MSKYGRNWGDVVMVGDKQFTRTDMRHPKLAGLEGYRVEITFADDWDYRGKVIRANVGQTMGPHVTSLLLHNARSLGGEAVKATTDIVSVKVIRKIR